MAENFDGRSTSVVFLPWKLQRDNMAAIDFLLIQSIISMQSISRQIVMLFGIELFQKRCV